MWSSRRTPHHEMPRAIVQFSSARYLGLCISRNDLWCQDERLAGRLLVCAQLERNPPSEVVGA